MLWRKLEQNRLLTLSILLLSLVLVLGAAGCREAAAPDEPDEPTPADDPDPDVDPDTPRYGGTFVVAGSFEPDHFNPCITTTGGVRFVSANVLPSIVRVTTELEVLPYLARDWDISADGLTYTFYLVENAQWEDGTPITAHDVVFSWGEVIPEYNIQGTALTANWKEVRAEGDYTVVLEMEHPEPVFMLTADRLGIIPKHLYEGTDILENPHNLDPISGGPFKFVEYVRGSHFELVRNENHWEEDYPYLDRIVYRFITDPIARLTALEAADIDYTSGYLSVTEAVRIAEHPNIEMIMGGHWGHASISSNLVFNLRREPFDNLNVRQAIAHAIDLEYILDVVTGGLGRIATGHAGSGNWAYTPDVPMYEFDPAKAEEMLNEAGLTRGSDGKRFSMDLVVASNQAEHLDIMEILVDFLSEVGIEVIPKPMEPAAFDEYAFYNWDFDACMRGIATGINPTGHAMWRAYHSDNIRPERIVNNAGYSNARVDELFDTARIQPTVEDAKPYLHEIQQILKTELPSIPMLERFEPYMWRNEFRGKIPSYYGNWSRIWWTGGELR